MFIILTSYVRFWIKFIQPFLPFFLFPCYVCVLLSVRVHVSAKSGSVCFGKNMSQVSAQWPLLQQQRGCEGASFDWINPGVFLFLGNSLEQNVQSSFFLLSLLLFFFFHSVFHFHSSKGYNWIHYCEINEPVNFHAFCCIWAAPVP